MTPSSNQLQDFHNINISQPAREIKPEQVKHCSATSMHIGLETWTFHKRLENSTW